MIADIDNNFKISISRPFTDDARAKIKTQEDMELLQQDLKTISNWADDKLM